MRYIHILQLSAVLLTGYGAFTDLRYHKIYNKQTMSGIVMGLLLHMILGGTEGVMDSLLGLLLGSSFILIWILGMLKAGDVKLYMAIGALAGWRFCGYTMIYSILFGGVAAAFVMICRKSGKESFVRVKTYLMNLIYMKQLQRYRPEEEGAYFSFGGCIFVGTLITMWYLYIR